MCIQVGLWFLVLLLGLFPYVCWFALFKFYVIHFTVSYFFVFYCYLFETYYFLMRDRKKVDLYGRVVGRELRCVEGEETNQDNLNEKKMFLIKEEIVIKDSFLKDIFVLCIWAYPHIGICNKCMTVEASRVCLVPWSCKVICSVVVGK